MPVSRADLLVISDPDKLAALLHTYLPAGIVLLAPDARILAANGPAAGWLGLALPSLTSGTLSLMDVALVRPDGVPLSPAEHPIERARATRQPVRDCVVGILGSGSECSWVRLDVHPEYAAGELQRIVVILLDVTAARLAGQRSLESERRFAEAQQVARMGSFEWDPDTDLLWCSQGLCELHGFRAVGPLVPFAQLLAVACPEDRAAMLTRREALRAGQDHFEVDLRCLRPDGTYYWIHRRVRAVHAADGRLLRIDGTDVDITERKQAEEASRQLREQLLQAQKMESVGRLAGGVAHDFNNLLTVQQGYCELLLRRLLPGDPLHGYAEEIQAAGSRAVGLTRQLLAFSRKQTLQPKVLDLNLLVTGLGSMLRRLLGEDVELVIASAAAPALVQADPGQLEQVLLNLAVNGRDAMPDGGRLRIEVSTIDFDAQCAEAQLGVAPGHYAMLTVRDTGHGMDEETRRHIFEPFFTTKDAGKGTGLGLSTVHGIVHQSGGNVWVHSSPGKGATFKVVLPRVDVADVVLQSEQPAMPRGAGELVLLVEDEGALRRLGQQLIESLGYRVQVAEHGAEALQLLAQQGLVPDLLITDVVMPGMNGRVLAERALLLLPGLRVLFMSGYTDDATLQHGIESRHFDFLEKPFTLAGLAQRIRAVLGQSA